MMNDEGGMMNDGMMSTIHQWALNDNNWSFDHARAGWRFALPSTSRRLCVKESSSHSAANVRLVGGGQTGLEVPGEVIWSSSIIFCIIYTIWYYVIWNHIILYYSILYDILLLYNFIHQKKVWPLSLHFWGPRGARTTATAERSCPAAPYAKGVTSWGEAFAGAAGGNLVNLSQVWGCGLLGVFVRLARHDFYLCGSPAWPLIGCKEGGGNPRWVTSILLSACGPQDHICIHSLQIVVLESHPEIWISGKWPLEWLFFHVGTKNPWNRQVWNFSWLDCLYLFNLYAMYLFIYPKSTAVSALFWHVS